MLTPALAQPGFRVANGQVSASDGVYYLDARLEVALSDVARRSLNKGVPLVINRHLEVLRERAWWPWAATVAARTDTYRLQYHALPERYLLTRLDTGKSRSFRDIEDMLQAFGEMDGLRVIERRQLNADGVYHVALQAELDLAALPRPLQTLAYLSSGWRLASDWRSWRLNR